MSARKAWQAGFLSPRRCSCPSPSGTFISRSIDADSMFAAAPGDFSGVVGFDRSLALSPQFTWVSQRHSARSARPQRAQGASRPRAPGAKAHGEIPVLLQQKQLIQNPRGAF